MNLTVELLPASWYWASHVLLAGLFADLARNAPWRRLAMPALLNVWLGSIVTRAVLWSTASTGVNAAAAPRAAAGE